VDRERLAAGGGFGIASADSDDGRVARFIHIDAVIARAEQREGGLRSIDFDGLVVGEAAQADVQCSERELDLRGLVVKIQESKIGAAIETEGGGAEIQFGARAFFGP